jgi:integrase
MGACCCLHVERRERRRTVKVQEPRPGKFRVQLRDPLNPEKRISIWGDSKTDVIARAVAAKRKRCDIRAGVGDPREHQAHLRLLSEGPYTIERAWHDYIARKPPDQRRNVAGYWKNHYARFFASLTLIQATADVLARWEQWIAEHLKASTIAVVYSMLSSAVKLSIPHRIASLPWEPWRPTGIGLPASEEREALRSMDEVRAVLLAARARDVRARRDGHIGDWEARLTLATFTGMRQGEIGGLAWEDVPGLDSEDPAEHLMWIRHQVKRHWDRDHPEWKRPLDPPKGHTRTNKKKPRKIVPQRLHADAVRVLRGQRERLRQMGWYRPDGPVFPGEDGAWRVDSEAIKVEVFREIVEESGIRCDLANMVPHSLRHTFTTLEAAALHAAGQNLRSLQERTRHADASMLQVYMHTSGRGLVPPLVPALDLPPEVPEHVATFDASEPAAPPELTGLTSERATAIERERQARELARDLKGHRDADVYAAALAEWDSLGRKGKFPPSLSKHLGRVYSRRYMAELREATGGNVTAATEEEKHQASAAALRSRRQAERRWTQFVRSADDGRIPVAKTRPDIPAEREREHHGN